MVDETKEDGYGFKFVNPLAPQQQQQQQRGGSQEDNALLNLLSRSDMLKVIQEYLDDKNIPLDEKGKFWGVHSKFLSISFFNRDDIEDLLLVCENVELIDIMSKPPEDYTWDKMQSFEQMKLLVRTQIKRSVGDGSTNERKLQNTQIGQMITTPTSEPSARGGGIRGTLQKIFG